MNFFKLILNKILYRERSDSDSYIRYLKKHGCKIGKGVKFYSPRTTTIDEVRQDWISIGDYTKITQGVIILAHDYSPSVCIHTHKKILLQGGEYTVIGKNCFLGMNCIILPGKHVGNNCIIGAGAVVASDIPDNSVCAGNPAKVIMTLDEFYNRCKQNYIQSAVRTVNHFKKKRNRVPDIGELHGFSFLFLDKTEENWNKYFSDYLSLDNNPLDVRAAFFETPSVFDSYSEFIKFCSEEDINEN